VDQPELSVLLASMHVRGAVEAEVNRALSSAPNWTRLVELALRHRLAPALLSALEAADTQLVPSDLLVALRTHCQRLRAHSLALLEELFSVLDALEQRSVTAVSFKGPLLGQQLFGDVGQRYPGDLDLLVHQEDVTTVCDVLEARGFVDAVRSAGTATMISSQHEMYRRVQCEHLYIRDFDGAIVEPHWGLSQRALAVDVDYAGMLSRAEVATLCGRPVLTLAPPDLLLALCVHGAKHHWDRLAWIRDVAALLSCYPELDLETCLDTARRAGCGRILLLGLAVALRFAAQPLPPFVARRIAEDHDVQLLVSEVIEGLFEGHGRPLPANDRVHGFRLRMRERWSDRVRYIGRTWLLPRREHIEMVALPRPLVWGYVPLKLVVDCIVGPAWQLVKPAMGRGRGAD
jgi:hypothetical protein